MRDDADTQRGEQVRVCGFSEFVSTHSREKTGFRSREEPRETRQTRKPAQDPVRWVEALLATLGAHRTGKKWQCPAHATVGEHSVSLRLARGDDGRLLLFCHAGCDWRDILRALKLPGSVLMVAPPTPPAKHARFYLRAMKFPEPKSGGGSPSERGFRFEAEHAYGQPAFAWKIRLRHPTTREKEITWESLNPKGERVPGLLGRKQADFPLYLEKDVRMAMAAGEPVILCESESSVDALGKAGWYATTWAGGAADPPVERIRELLGNHGETLLIPDNDDAGRRCAEKLIRAATVRHLLMGDPGEDARDLLDRRGPGDFRAAVEAALKPAEAATTPSRRRT